MEPKHACAICKGVFDTEALYLEHVCTTGFKPADFEHQVALDPSFAEVSKSAVKRGEARAGEAEHPADVAAKE